MNFKNNFKKNNFKKTGWILNLTSNKNLTIVNQKLHHNNNQDNIWYIDAILAERFNYKTKRKEFLIKWSGYSNTDNTWEPESNIPDNIIKDFKQNNEFYI